MARHLASRRPTILHESPTPRDQSKPATGAARGLRTCLRNTFHKETKGGGESN